VLVSHGNIRVAGEVEDLLAAHRVLTGPASESERIAQPLNVVHASRTASQAHLFVRGDSTPNPVPPGWEARSVTLEELTMAYLRESGAATSSPPTRGWGDESPEVTR
jgi:ABC-2 type transport system ATP-binding protein